MRQDASTISWAQEGEEWIRLAQTSDQRLYFVMPYMLDKLQDVAGKNILDLGCGEGGYARALARIFEKPVKAVCLYSFHLDEFLTV